MVESSLSRGLVCALVVAGACALSEPTIAESAVTEQMEVLRGTEKRMIFFEPESEPGPGSRATANATGAEEDHAVEVVFGIDPSSRSVAFETRRYELSSDERRSIRARVYRMIELYRSELGIRVPVGFRVDLAIHGKGRPYDRRAGALRRAAGFYDPESRKAVVSGRKQDETHRTALHESSHAVLMQAVPRIPAWLNEGLAEYFERLEVAAGSSRVPADARRHGYLAARLRAGEGWSLPELLDVSHRSWLRLDERSSYLAYTQSWSVVRFLMETDARRGNLRALLAALEPSGHPSREAVERQYPGGVERLEADWRAWLARKPRSHRY